MAMLTIDQLRKEFQISREKVNDLVSEGMPVMDFGTDKKHAYRFDFEAVTRWMSTRGAAKTINTGRMKRR